MKRYLILILLTLSLGSIQAQDIFFSQFYAAHLSINPALTGFTLGDMQFSTIYRNRTQYLIPSYTYGASLDLKISRDMIKPDMFAAGAMVVLDNVKSGAISSLNAMASGAYHKAIGYDDNHYVAFGAQVGIFQRSTDPYSFSYDEQWDTDQKTYNSGLPITENFSKEQSTNFDLNLGLLWYSKIAEKNAFYVGGSVYHLHEPKESFMDLEEHFARRFIVHGGGRIAGNAQVAFIPNLIYMSQNKNQQFVGGFHTEYMIEDTRTAIRLGGWYRNSDNNIIFSAGLRVMSLQFGISSDFISPVQTVSRTRGALEFSILYSPYFKKSAKLEADPTRSF